MPTRFCSIEKGDIPMNISINGRNMKMTPRIEQYVEKKTARLDRYMPNLAEVRVDLSEEKSKNVNERQVAQITVRDKRGTFLRAEERNSDLFAAIDAVIDKLYVQIRRYRGKQRRRWRKGGTREEFLGDPLPMEEAIADDMLDATQSIVRVKQFPLQPMTPEEAIDQIELLGHDFFMFLNANEDSINVLYRRRRGDYGLLQPELD